MGKKKKIIIKLIIRFNKSRHRRGETLKLYGYKAVEFHFKQNLEKYKKMWLFDKFRD